MLACNGGAWTDCAALVMNTQNWPEMRGMAVGLTKAALGLGAPFYTSLYLGLIAPRVADFLLLLAVLPLALGLLAMPFFNHVPFVERSELEARALSTGEVLSRGWGGWGLLLGQLCRQFRPPHQFRPPCTLQRAASCGGIRRSAR